MTFTVYSIMYTVLGEIRGFHRMAHVHKHLLDSTTITEHQVEDSFLQYIFNFNFSVL